MIMIRSSRRLASLLAVFSAALHTLIFPHPHADCEHPHPRPRVRPPVRALLASLAVMTVAATTLGLVAVEHAAASAYGTDFGSFSDDDRSVHEVALAALAAEGVLARTECGPDLICPDLPLKRWEMAVWLTRVRDGDDPAALSASRFGDVDADRWWTSFVDRLYELEVTRGCAADPPRFCPDDSVTRAQMATFLVRAFDLEPGPSAGFADTAGNYHASDIDALAAAGITAGCTVNPARFCPSDSVTRGEMATFLARALGHVERPSSEATLVDIAVGDLYSCGLKSDDTISCWGTNQYGQTQPPDGTYTAISTGEAHSCALRADSTVVCWGRDDYGQTQPPAGRFSAVAAGYWHSCAVRIDSAMVCWGRSDHGQTTPPEGAYSAVAAGEAHSCGLQTHGTVVCWGQNIFGQTEAPGGQFNTVVVGSSHSCGLHTNGTMACWGQIPECSTRSDGAILCQGSDVSAGTVAPEGTFSAVAAGRYHSCGLRTQGTIVCWGVSDYLIDALGGRGDHLMDAPDGQFSSIVAGKSHSCSRRTDAVFICWGTPPEPPPAGVQHTERGHTLDCRPLGLPYGGTAGFPLPEWAAPSTGKVRIGVLFMDFPDAVADYTTQHEAELGLSFAEEYLEAMSYGSVDIDFVPLHRWLRAAHPYSHYMRSSADSDVKLEATRLAGPEFDLNRFKILMVVLPSSHFGGGIAYGPYTTAYENLTAAVTINAFPKDTETDPTEWGTVAAHELLHNLGLLDLYPLGGDYNLPKLPEGKEWLEAKFGIMVLRAHSLVSPEDPRLAHVFEYPDGYRSTAHSLVADASQMLAWSRWQLGWLHPAQVRCVTERQTNVTLSPIARHAANSVTMAAIPLSARETIVIESRRKIGYDAGHERIYPNGVRTTFPGLTTEGVLVYTVNASLGGGELPLRIAGTVGDSQVEDYPILTLGRLIKVRGYIIAVRSDNGTTHTISITRA